MNSELIFNPRAQIVVDGDHFRVDAPVRHRGRICTQIDSKDGDAWRFLTRLATAQSAQVVFTDAEVNIAANLGLLIEPHAASLLPHFSHPLSFTACDCCAAEASNCEILKNAHLIRDELTHQGYAIVKHCLPQAFAQALERYCGALVTEGYMRIDTRSDRWSIHNDPVGAGIHRNITALVQRFVPTPIKPSYAYLVSYRPGAVLPRHVDREQCEYTVSISLGQVPTVDSASAWPLFIEPMASSGPVEIRLGVGDAVIFRGREVAHYREALANSQAARALFLHFVPEHFTGNLD